MQPPGVSVFIDQMLSAENRDRRYRYLPLASDRDRIAAARYAAEKLAIRLAIIARRRRLLWEHYSDSNGAVVSTNA